MVELVLTSVVMLRISTYKWNLSTSNEGNITFLYFLLHNCMQNLLLR